MEDGSILPARDSALTDASWGHQMTSSNSSIIFVGSSLLLQQVHGQLHYNLLFAEEGFNDEQKVVRMASATLSG